MASSSNIISYIEAGMVAEGARQQAIANNIANMNTPGYRRIDVKFEDILAKAIESGGKIDKADLKPEIFQPKNTALKSNGNDVNMETEVGQMVKNSLRHKTFMMLLKKKYGQYKAAMGRQ